MEIHLLLQKTSDKDRKGWLKAQRIPLNSSLNLQLCCNLPTVITNQKEQLWKNEGSGDVNSQAGEPWSFFCLLTFATGLWFRGCVTHVLTWYSSCLSQILVCGRGTDSISLFPKSSNLQLCAVRLRDGMKPAGPCHNETYRMLPLKSEILPTADDCDISLHGQIKFLSLSVQQFLALVPIKSKSYSRSNFMLLKDAFPHLSEMWQIC